MKKEYEKPLILVQADLSEGVYLASGATEESESGSKNVNYRSSKTGDWDNHTQWSITPTSEGGEGWVIVINFTGNIASYTMWSDCTVSCSGSTMILTAGEWTKTIDCNNTFNFQVDGEAGAIYIS